MLIKKKQDKKASASESKNLYKFVDLKILIVLHYVDSIKYFLKYKQQIQTDE